MYFDSGDCHQRLETLEFPYDPKPVWSMLHRLRCDASVLGNRETHPLAPMFDAKLAGSLHPILCANLRRKDGSRPLPGHLILNVAGTRVGVVGVMVPIVTEKMKTQIASSYLWDPPVSTAVQVADELREKVDVLFALTHVGHRTDLELARTQRFQVIFGAHSHTVLEHPQKEGRCWIAQGGSHNRFAGVYDWDGELRGGLVAMPR